MTLNILAIVAHPADAFDMIGGTLATHVEQGDRVVIAITNNTDTLNDARLADEIRAGRVKADQATLDAGARKITQTVIEACEILGVTDVRLLDYPGEWLTVTPELRSEVATLIQQIQPHIVITHHPLEEGGAAEHSACGRLVVEATAVAEGARANGLPPHHVGQTYFFCPGGQTTWMDAVAAPRYGMVMIDVTQHVDRKVRAYAKLSSQYIDLHKAAKIIEAVSGLAAVHARVPYAEGFIPNRPEVYDALPISDHNKQLAEGSWKLGLDRLQLIAPYLDGVQQADRDPDNQSAGEKGS